ncbi:MAG: hypothetical protein ONB23_01925 [candidate division KSB1 bacterium]|nr:hypothetical protein [candidate division KSB1 bacterium]
MRRPRLHARPVRPDQATRPGVALLRLSAEEFDERNAQLLLDLVEAAVSLRAYVELFDPTTGTYRICLVGRLLK